MQKIKYTPTSQEDKKKIERKQNLCKILGWVIVVFNASIIIVPLLLTGNPLVILFYVLVSLSNPFACLEANNSSLACQFSYLISLVCIKVFIGLAFGTNLIKGIFKPMLLIADIVAIAISILVFFIVPAIKYDFEKATADYSFIPMLSIIAIILAICVIIFILVRNRLKNKKNK